MELKVRAILETYQHLSLFMAGNILKGSNLPVLFLCLSVTYIIIITLQVFWCGVFHLFSAERSTLTFTYIQHLIFTLK